jgi:hypothetical protein
MSNSLLNCQQSDLKRLPLMAIALLSMGLAMALPEANAQSSTCQRGNANSCLGSPQLKWAFSQTPFDKNAEAPEKISRKIERGPKFSPSLTPIEIENSRVFCRYYFHQFSSQGSAKFLCAKTNSEGILYDEDGELVPDAKNISTRPMKLTTQLNGKTVAVDEGFLLDSNNRPLIKKDERSGLEELVQADELKVKYFVDAQHYEDKNVQRSDLELVQKNAPTVSIKNAFNGPHEVTNPRWNEVFTEIAATRLFWALGIPADTMLPLNQVVCFGCLSHPKKQGDHAEGKVSVFNTISLEKKMKGKKLAEGFDVNVAQRDFRDQWTPETQIGFELLALASRLIGFENVIALQTRMQCAPKKFNPENQTCDEPIAIIQDTGSSFAAVTKSETNPRGSLNDYIKETVFKDAATCTLFHPFGKNTWSTGSHRMKKISTAGLQEMKRRLEPITRQNIESIVRVSKFADMEPALRDRQPGNTLEEKRESIIRQWTDAIEKRVTEIKNIGSCK